jgi:hypothetical protein
MFYVVADSDDREPSAYRWLVYDYTDPSNPVKRAEYSYPTRGEAIDAGWAAVSFLEQNGRP